MLASLTRLLETVRGASPIARPVAHRQVGLHEAAE
jgi:hypothetical protein